MENKTIGWALLVFVIVAAIVIVGLVLVSGERTVQAQEAPEQNNGISISLSESFLQNEILPFFKGLFGGKVITEEDETFGATGTRFPNGVSVGTSTPTGGKLTVGDQGTAIDDIIFGTCNATGPVSGLAASSTATYFCSVTGASNDARIFVSLPQQIQDGSGNTSLFHFETGIWHNGVAYSTTTNKIAFELTNMTGVATTSFAQATTGIQYMIIR